MPEKLTVLIPCKNERRNIRECIESVRQVADEILVADSGSTDGTLEIVESLGGCRVIQNDWTGYAPFKNWAMSHASHEWILNVDADERVTPELAEEIRAVMAKPQEDLDGYAISFRTYFMGRLLRFSSWNNAAVRLIRRGRGRYIERRVHESMQIEPDRVGRLKGKLLHFSFWSYDEYFEKYVRYSKLAAEELHERGKRPGVYDLLIRPFLRFFHLFILKRGFLDGLAGIQICMLTAFFYSFAKQARLWEMEAVAEYPAAAEQESAAKVATNEQPGVLPLPAPVVSGDRSRVAA
jgi:glycosyltransferase involved in cell wall biosynthesis